jgi:acetoacetate decarboxylase
MGFVAKPEEVREYLQFLALCESRREDLTVAFRTSAEFARSVLPPCFDVPAEPTCFAYVGSSREFYKGRGIRGADGEEEVAGISVLCEYEGRQGEYHLSTIRSGDMMITVGRELWGNQKKRGESRLYDDGRLMYGYAERQGTRLIQIEANLDPVPVPVDTRAEALSFLIKGWLDAPAYPPRFQDDPWVIVLNSAIETTSLRQGDPAETELQLQGTLNDPLDEIPVLGIISTTYRTYRCLTKVEKQAQLQNADDYIPYVLGLNWDISVKHAYESKAFDPALVLETSFR